MRKAYIDYEGVEYYDYDVYCVNRNDNDCWGRTPKEDAIMISSATATKLLDIIAALKNNPVFTPAKGDEICVIPDCKYNLEDVRRNYKIKRGYDKGTCNVFSEETIKKFCGYGPSYCIALIPSKKSAVIDYYNYPEDLYKTARSLFSDITKKDVIIMKQMCGSSPYHFFNLFSVDISEAYIKLLTGALTKPAVHIENLDLNTGEQLTLDALEIVHKLCEEKVNNYSSGWDEKLKLQLAALNGLDWRKYPGTINILFNGFDYWCNSAINEMRGTSSRYPKNVRTFLKFSSDKFASQEDMDLACAFIRKVMDLENTQFTTLQDIWNKLAEKQVIEGVFLKLFDNMVRFKDKEWKDE